MARIESTTQRALRLLTSSLLWLPLLASMGTAQAAGEGEIILQRTVQPRVATRAPLQPDPHPIQISANPSAQIIGATQGSLVNGELGDSDFAGVSSGAGLTGMTQVGGAMAPLNNLAGGLNQSLGNSAGSHTGGSSGGGLGGQISGTIQNGLAPLQLLGGSR